MCPSKLMVATRRAIASYVKGGYLDVTIRRTTSGNYRLTLRHDITGRMLRMYVYTRESRIIVKRNADVLSDYVVG